MEHIRTIVIDDEPRARETIINMLNLYCPSVNVVGEGVDVSSGISQIELLNPDLVLLDIKMPDGTGFDLLNRLNKRDFNLVFITAFDEYAIKAFKYNAIDYLLKPIDPDDMVAMLSRYKKRTKRTSDELSLVLNNLKDLKKEHKKLVLKTTDNIYVVSISNIIRCESTGNYTKFYVLDHQYPIMVSKTLKEYESILVNHRFFRVHQSHLVNLEGVRRFHKSDGGSLVMDNGDHVPVATRRRELLMNALSLL